MAMKYVNNDIVQKNTNNLSHHVNTSKRVIKLMGIWKYANKGDAKAVSKLISKGESPNVENEERRTPLHYAAESGHIDVVTVLLSSGASINHRDMHGDTAMHCALRGSEPKHEEMAMFLMGRGCDLNVTNTANISCWELAEKKSRRFYIKMKDNTKCSNPTVSSRASAAVAAKPAALPPSTQRSNPLLDQVVLFCGQYAMYLRGLPPPGSAPATSEPLPAPFPTNPHDALKAVHGRWLGYMNELVLTSNKDPTSNPNFRGTAQSLKDHIARQVELTKSPISDGMIYASLQSDLFTLASNSIDMLSQYEESVVSRAFTSHIEKITLTLRKAAEGPAGGVGGVGGSGGGAGPKWDPSEFVIDYVMLNRNVLTQLLYISDPDKSKKISDGLYQLSQSVKSFVEAKTSTSSFRAPLSPDASNAHIRVIADNLRRMHTIMAQSGASSALFPDEEVEVFDSAIAAFNAILSLPVPIAFSAKRPIQILLSEIAYIKEAAFSSPLDRDVLLNCALFVHCTSTRLARSITEGRKLKEPTKTVADHVAGLLTLCGNIVLLVACALVTKNKSYQFVHIGYALRGIAHATALIVDPAYGITTY